MGGRISFGAAFYILICRDARLALILKFVRFRGSLQVASSISVSGAFAGIINVTSGNGKCQYQPEPGHCNLLIQHFINSYRVLLIFQIHISNFLAPEGIFYLLKCFLRYNDLPGMGDGLQARSGIGYITHHGII